MNFLDFQADFWFYWFIFCGFILGGYFVTASSLYWFLHWALDKQSLGLSQPDYSQRRTIAIGKDIQLSVLSGLLFAFGAACFMIFYEGGITRVYSYWRMQDLGYLVFSYAVTLFLQDTCFYFTHRLFHLPLLFKWIHHSHYQSRPPTPWTLLALDPIETTIQASFLIGVTLNIPLHLGVLVAILLTMAVWTTGNHLGFKVIPSSQLSRWWGQWFIGSTHHLVHHRQCNLHYGLYFTFWDRFLDTQDTNYE